MRKEKLTDVIREVPDFPKEGIIFRDITPLLQKPVLCREIVQDIVKRCHNTPPDAIAAMESRGFLFGFLLAEAFQVPFIPIRKKGKLPYKKISQSYDLEYGTAEIEIHLDAIQPKQKVLIHDDLLATGGTADAAATLVKRLSGKIHSFHFIVELEALKGREPLEKYHADIHSLVHY